MHGKDLETSSDTEDATLMGKSFQNKDHKSAQRQIDGMVLSSPPGIRVPLDVSAEPTQFSLYEQSQPKDKLKKKGSGVFGKSIEEELCKICGDRASGYHYNALSCEGCKGFFRRSITRGASYNCKYGGNCEMDMWMRRKCQACRLRKCQEVGMKEECLLSDEQCKARDTRRKAKQRTVPKISESSGDSFNCSNSVLDGVFDEKVIDTKPQITLPPETIIEDEPLLKTKPEYRELIEKIVFLQNKYEFPDDDIVASVEVTNPATASKEEMGYKMLGELAKITIFITQLIVKFAKHLPGFNFLSRQDQIVLLKASSCEVTAIRAARCYDPKSKCIVLANGLPMTCDNMKATGQSVEYCDLIYNFCHALTTLQMDNSEFGLFTAICIFSDRQNLIDVDKVEQIQKIYLDAFEDYIDKKRLQGRCALAKFLIRLTDLRSISVEHTKMLTDMMMDESMMPKEVRDIYMQT
ncbi:hypothetical protein ScPMuIL_015411 [Solemya velum]